MPTSVTENHARNLLQISVPLEDLMNAVGAEEHNRLVVKTVRKALAEDPEFRAMVVERVAAALREVNLLDVARDAVVEAIKPPPAPPGASA